MQVLLKYAKYHELMPNMQKMHINHSLLIIIINIPVNLYERIFHIRAQLGHNFNLYIQQ